MEKYRYSDEELKLLESSKVPFAIYQFIDKRVITLVLSEGFFELAGYQGRDKKDIYNLMDTDMYRDAHPDDMASINDAVYRFVTDGGVYDVIYRMKRDGEYRIIHSYGRHIYKEDGTRLAFIWYTDQGCYVGDSVNGSEAISGEYARLQQENERLRKEADAARKIMKLKKSVSDLLANMPAMTFSKDVNTRKYLACNQAFADYAHKETPEEVVGLTDFEIFDEETALHFIEDDKKALAMDKPYIFYEDVPDAAGNPKQFQTTKLKFTDDTGRECLLGLCQDVTDAMRIKREYSEKLALVQNMAEIDSLTGIKNKNAYKERENLMNQRIIERRQPEFAIVVLDVNDLKRINDTEGHEAGDRYICDACEIVCKTFKRSPVYRVGGDEFVVISQDEDYARSDELVNLIASHNENALLKGGVIIACGMAKFDKEDSVAEVFEIADKRMYDNKKTLKMRKKALNKKVEE
ncbi:diguanylate cyclase (GGDEF) domain-containing protein [Butyrivibrio proteoclasticus]|uniref:Diguanylate cyclase (GGDEF) domain-containing protein n=1 Tax=Butyrivibrio proteoclasticus TaxID=43305 RepID=A0A1I5XQR6_9FIRM|nr:diguanylate cyclase [Butyrivibrio proteoclasticus]SFQ34289.1 diguanylate cyclase (GGDEF) domain-containing protein [Butyrivibrio proteoclasticus]